MKAEEFIKTVAPETEIRYWECIKLMTDYARLKCAEQREICAGVFRDRCKNYTMHEQFTNYSIKESSEPEL